MTKLKTGVILVFLLSALSCKEDKKVVIEDPVPVGISTFYFIRHAEKDRSNPEDQNPELSQSGLGRAMHWNEIFKDVQLDAIYSTDYARTSMTAAPTSVARDIDIEYYDPSIIDLEQFKADNLNKNVLVVGHSDTTPDFVNKMLGEQKYNSMDDADNGSLFIVQIVNGIPTSQQIHINCNCPK